MKKLSRNQAWGVAAALAVVAFLLYGNFFIGIFNHPVSTEATMPAQSGLQVVDEVVGTGTVAEPGDTVTVNYVGTLTDGKVFDSSVDRNQPFVFQLGVGQVIPGWDQGLLGMHVGGKRRLTIPPELGYGSQVVGPIPANSTLIFEVTLLNVSKGSATATQ